MFKTHRHLPALLFVAGVAAAAPACAAQTYGYGYPRSNAGYGRDIERRAYDNGYREGLQEGRNDGQRNRNFSPERHSEFRDADNGYHRGDGDRDFYRRAYRQGFQTGYRESFDRIARSNGGYGGVYGNRGGVYNAPVYQDPRVVNPRGGYSNISAQNGYRDGVEAGRNDARDRARFDPVRAKRYRDGDHDYNNRYGDRDTYKREYRTAFEQGYREGYGRTR
jgi:hypothetical protein